MENPRCYLGISIGGELKGRIVVELHKDVHKTAEKFSALCTCEKGIGPNTGVPLHDKYEDLMDPWCQGAEFGKGRERASAVGISP